MASAVFRVVLFSDCGLVPYFSVGMLGYSGKLEHCGPEYRIIYANLYCPVRG